ncbi:DNA mismatch repair protein C-terminal [Penicillium expansum]|nr:DNA mismatch repair protein C-terminal [Penicillium expansum]
MATIQAIEARSVHQIQSGQVIVDLCSVAKELVENSLDAGATTIEVRFKNNGLDLIEVQDNGSGISPENYENVALKHYTSKLSSYDDLSSLHTFGFRGEAISSLCALADFHIVTAQEKQVPRANRLDFEQSGKLRKTQIVAGQKGTTASVEGIFKRLPVRRRELEKNIKREYGKVLNLLHAYACISTGVRFSVRNTVGKTRNVVVFSTNGNKTTKENIANVYGAKTLSALISLDLELEFEPATATKRAGDDQLSKIQVRGHISRPVFGEGRQTPDRQMFFVNSRPCGLPQIQKAFNEVYKSFNVSQSAFIFADFQMDTNAYDVNVSPDKRQILLHDAGAMIESLKVSLAQLFADADQTVPQSTVKSKPLPKQQPLSSLPGFVTARELSESSGLTTPNQDRTKESSVDTPGASQQSAIQRFASSQAGMGSAQATPSPARSMRTPRAATNRSSMSTPAPSELETPAAAISDDELFVREATQEEPDPTPISQEPSSQPSAPDETPSRARGDPAEIPNIVQNAFDRMRPRREPAELATITIGNRTITSMVGSGPPRKRFSEDPPLMREPPRRKRRIHTPSRPNIFGEHMKAFAAPGSQLDDEEDEEGSASEDDQVEENGDDILSEIEETQDDVDYVPDQDIVQSETGNTETKDKETAADENLDEAEKKAQEEATVQRLIHQAEETAMLPQENSVNRAKKMSKGATHRDATIQLVGTVDGSISSLQSQLITLQRTMQAGPKKTEEEATDLGERTAEDKLSLTVSKNDFAQMRIIGQFNLGFIIAVRPGEDHDELFIIDQHASDEKFNFERLQAETVVQNQRLVRPQRLDLTAVEEEVVLENRVALEKNGFLVTIDESGDEPIGRRCQLVSLPLSKEVVFGVRDLEELIVLLSESISTSNGASVPRPSKVRKMFAMRACRSSIMIGKTLTSRQMERVVQNMGTIDKPWNCPHGRPTMRHLMSLGQWDEWNEFQETEELDPWKQYLEAEGEEDEDEEE